MSTKTVDIDVHKSTSQIAVVNDEGTVLDDPSYSSDVAKSVGS